MSMSETLKNISLDISYESYKEYLEFFDFQAWDEKMGLLILLQIGFESLSGKYQANANGSTNDADELIRIKQMFLSSQSNLAALRFRYYETLEANKNWNLSTGAVMNENTALLNLVKQLKLENSEIKKNLAALCTQTQEPENDR
jgi:hypothetical protein